MKKFKTEKASKPKPVYYPKHEPKDYASTLHKYNYINSFSTPFFYVFMFKTIRDLKIPVWQETQTRIHQVCLLLTTQASRCLQCEIGENDIRTSTPQTHQWFQHYFLFIDHFQDTPCFYHRILSWNLQPGNICKNDHELAKALPMLCALQG